jgi:hypothetical protein
VPRRSSTSRLSSSVFQNRDVAKVSGRALLHALGAAGAALCGQAAERLTPTGSEWDMAYLPHVPRCAGCVAATGSGDAGRNDSVPALPAAAVAELGPRLHYGWVYRQILDDPARFGSFLDRHDIRVPAQPPVPRRCINIEW